MKIKIDYRWVGGRFAPYGAFTVLPDHAQQVYAQGESWAEAKSNLINRIKGLELPPPDEWVEITPGNSNYQNISPS